MFRVKHSNHLVFFNGEYGRGRDRGRRPDTNILSCQATLTKKVARGKDRHDGLFASLIDNGQFYPAILDVQDIPSRVTLSVDLLRFSVLHNSSRDTGRMEKTLGIENGQLHVFELFNHRFNHRSEATS